METDLGPVLILGCCHSGPGNTMAHINDILGGETPYALIGGTHLHDNPADIFEQFAKRLEPIEQIYPNHCTGTNGWAKLHHLIGDKVKFTGAGTVVNFSTI